MSLYLNVQANNMVTLKMIFASLLSGVVVSDTYNYTTNLKFVSPNDSLKATDIENKVGLITKFAEEKSKISSRDSGGNYGDLIYRFRENGDTLLLREVLINEVLDSNDKDIIWTVSIRGARITSVRVLNFGRERAYCLRIDIAGGDIQVVLRIPSLKDPRVMIDIYGF